MSTIRSAPFSCSITDPTHTLPSLADSEFTESYGYSLSTPVTNTTSGESCRTATYPYGSGALHLTSDSINNYVDTTLPIYAQIHKKHTDSFLLIEWNTAFQCDGTDVTCRWEVILNGKYSCSPTAYHDIHSSPSGSHMMRDTFTAICSHWTYGGRTKIPPGLYNVTLVQSSLNMFHGEKWIEPRGTQPHGRLPTSTKGAPYLGDGYFSSFQVTEVQESNTRTVFHEKRAYLTRGISTTPDTTRSFVFTKQSDAATTALKITFYDNFRCHTRATVGAGVSAMENCLFEIVIDGNSCSPGALTVGMRADAHTSYMMGKTVKGVCTGIGAGTHTLQVRITGPAEPYLGMHSTTGLIYVEEVPAAQVGTNIRAFTAGCSHSASPALPAVCFPSVQGATNCVFTCRSFSFAKTTVTSVTKFELYDSFSCRNQDSQLGATCEAEIRVNGQSCTNPGPLKFVHTDDTTRNRFRSAIGYVGYCRAWGGAALGAGTHAVTLYTKPLAQVTTDAQCRSCVDNDPSVALRWIPQVGEDMSAFMEVSLLEPESETKCYMS